MSVLIDTDILIEVLRGKNADVSSKWVELSESGTLVVYSPVTVAELWAGIRPKEESAVKAFVEKLVCVSISDEIGRRAGAYLQAFHKSHALELGDTLIAATAVMSEAQLWTRNRKHYPMRDIKFFA